MKFKIGNRVSVTDSVCTGYGTITEIQREHDDSGWLYKVEYDDSGYDWLCDFEMEPA